MLSGLASVEFVFSLILAGCGIADKTNPSINWVLIGAAALLVIILGISLGVLMRTGRLTAWVSAGINAKKWKIQGKKLEDKIKNNQNKKEKLILGLGEKAWGSKVLDPSYADVFSTLNFLDLQKTELENDIKLLEEEQQRVNESRTNITTEYSNFILSLQSQLKEQEEISLNLKSQHAASIKELVKANKDLEKKQAEIEKKKKQLSNLGEPESPEQLNRVEELTNEIKSLERTINEAHTKIAELDEDLSRFDLEQQSGLELTASIKEQISTREDQKRDALKPVDDRLGELDELVGNKKANLSSLIDQMPSLIKDLGLKVDSVRPKSAVLNEEYSKIDDTSAKLAEAVQEFRLVTARLETSDKITIRNYWLMMIGFVILAAAIVILLIFAL